MNSEEKRNRYNEHSKKWRRENPVRMREIQRKSYIKNRDRIVLRNREKRENQKSLILEHYGNECTCCGEKRKEFLAIDHINGGGTQHNKELHNQGTYLYAWIIKNNYPKDLQILCHNCNMAIGLYGYCPHQIESGKLTEDEAIKISNDKALNRRIRYYKRIDS